MYDFATLDPRPTDEAKAANDAVFAAALGGVYGIEVTIPTLAARCTLGNLDPQHTEGRNMAACSAALECPLPPAGATLVTVRPDADSVLAMAVIERRANGVKVWDDRVNMVGTADSAPDGPWVRDYSPPEEFRKLSGLAMNHMLHLGQRVALAYGWVGGSLLMDDLRDVPADHSAIDVALSGCGRYAVARADGPAGRGAMASGYRKAPVVIAVNEAFSMRGETTHRKYTVARWNATHVQMDWTGMLAELQALEPGWGGSSSICGSPQGVGSTLTMEQVTAIVERHL